MWCSIAVDPLALCVLLFGLLLFDYAHLPRCPSDRCTTLKLRTEGKNLMALASRKSQEQPQQESQKSYREILREEIAQGLREHQRPTKALLISGLSAGLDVSFSQFLFGVVFFLLVGVVLVLVLRFLSVV